LHLEEKGKNKKIVKKNFKKFGKKFGKKKDSVIFFQNFDTFSEFHIFFPLQSQKKEDCILFFKNSAFDKNKKDKKGDK
jgi:hypothetical protein